MRLLAIVLAIWVLLGAPVSSWAQSSEDGRHLVVLVPESAGSSPASQGRRSHTHLRVLAASEVTRAEAAQFNTPAMLRSVYQLPSSGGSNAIAIVDAYHYPTALADFNAFAGEFQLPQESSTTATSSANRVFEVVYATGKKPMSGGNYIASWNLEGALDTQWAHAIAPNAKIYLVEAASDSTSDLYYAVEMAASLPGVKEISMSWGGSESAGETVWDDSYFTANGIVYLAAGGDSSDDVEYPSVSPNVISCGGTSVNRNASGTFLNETGWSDTGCGVSIYEPRPAYQNAIYKIVGAQRGANDLAFDADPNTGVYVYDSTPLWGEGGWWIVGGTSLATPALAGVLNLAASTGTGFAANTNAEQTRLYANLGNGGYFRDITSGMDGRDKCTVGWDFVSGIGSPVGLSGK